MSRGNFGVHQCSGAARPASEFRATKVSEVGQATTASTHSSDSQDPVIRHPLPPQIVYRIVMAAATPRRGFEHSPITSPADFAGTPTSSNSASVQTLLPHHPRSAGQEGFEH